MHDVQFDFEVWHVRQLLVHISHVLEVKFKIVPSGHESIQALLYKIPLRQDLHK